MSAADEQVETAATVQTLVAYVAALEGETEAALRLLSGLHTPDAVRRRLAILNDAGRFREAADLVRGSDPHERWCDRAVTAFVRNGELERAEDVAAWAKHHQNPSVGQRCALALAEARHTHALRRRPSAGPPPLPCELDDDEKNGLRRALEPVGPLLATALDSGRTRTAFESLAVQIAIAIHQRLGDHADVKSLGTVLLTRVPVPLDAAQLVHQKTIPCPEGLPTRLRLEHPESFRAHELAGAIEAEVLNRPAEALDSAMCLARGASRPEEQERACHLLFVIAQVLGPEALEKVRQEAPSLLKGESSFLSLLQADGLLRAGKTDDAEAVLERVRDEADPGWLQQQANLLLQKGLPVQAIEQLEKAARIVPHPELLKAVAALAFRHSLLDKAAVALERVLSVHPDDFASRQNAAHIYAQQNEYGKASGHFATLARQRPAEPAHALNHARCLALEGDAEGSLRVYSELCAAADAPLEAYLRRVQILRSLGQEKEAFDFLHTQRGRFWDKPEYVSTLLDLGFASGNEAAAHDALARLDELQRSQPDAQQFLHPKTVDDLVEHIKGEQERVDTIRQSLVRGQFAWLMADFAVRHTSYWGWRLRTQPLDWVFDDPLNRAAFSIYATNGFAAMPQGDGTRELAELRCPAPGTPVVIDLSSLITLHRLGLLPAAAAYFGKIFLPSTYLTLVLSEGRRLGFHQLSMKTSAETIKAALDDGRLAVAPPDSTRPVVSEYTADTDTAHCYRLKDLAAVLHESGLLADTNYREFTNVARRPGGADGAHPPLRQGAAITCALSTLRTVSQLGLLPPLMKAFAVSITPEDRDAVLSEVRAAAAQAEVREWHRSLWEAVRGDGRFVHVTHTPPADFRVRPGVEEGDDERPWFDAGLAAPFLSLATGHPLLADDRVCQALVLNQPPLESRVAFGTDALLPAMGGAGLVGGQRVADGYLQLIRWRYRFVVIPPSVLVTLAKRFATHPPGAELQSVARYVYDCMRDPGLFGGLEPTSPPTTMANRVYQSWSAAVAEMLIDVWRDDAFTEESARALTRWAVSELLPSPPASMGTNGAVFPTFRAKLVLSRAMIRSIHLADAARAHRALAAIANGLGLSREEYLRTVTEVTGAI